MRTRARLGDGCGIEALQRLVRQLRAGRHRRAHAHIRDRRSHRAVFPPDVRLRGQVVLNAVAARAKEEVQTGYKISLVFFFYLTSFLPFI